MLQLCAAFCDQEEEGRIQQEEMDSDKQARGVTADDNDTEASRHSRFKLLYEAILLAGLPATSNLTTSEVVLCLDPMRRYRATPAPATISLTATTVNRAKEALGIQIEAAAAAAVATGEHSAATGEVSSSLQEGGCGGCQPELPPEPAAGAKASLSHSGSGNPHSSSPSPGSSVTGSQNPPSGHTSETHGTASERETAMHGLDPEMGTYDDDTTCLATRSGLQVHQSQHDDEHHAPFHPAADSSGKKLFSPSLSAAERELERKRVVDCSSNGSSSGSKQLAANGPAGDNRRPPADASFLSTVTEITPETGRHGSIGADLGPLQDDISLLSARVSLESSCTAPRPSILPGGAPSPRPVTPAKRTASEAAIDFTEDDDEIAPGIAAACQVKNSRSTWAREVEHDTKAIVTILQEGQWLSDTAMSVFAEAWAAVTTKTVTMRSTFINPKLQASKTTRTLHANIYAGHADTLACGLHSHSHWRALIAVPSQKTFRIYDSMRHGLIPGPLHGSHDPQHSALARLATLVFAETRVPPDDPIQNPQTTWVVEYPPTAKQANGSDCGVYAIVTLLRLTVGVDPAEELNAEEAKVWRWILTAMVSKTSLEAVMPWSYEKGLELTPVTLQARWRSSGASTLPLQSDTMMDAEELLQTQLGDALRTVQMRCDVFVKRKTDLEQAAVYVLRARQLLEPLEPLICDAMLEVQSRIQTARDEEIRLDELIKNLEQPFTIWLGRPNVVPWATELISSRDRTGMLRRSWETRHQTHEATLVRLRGLNLGGAVTRLNRWVGKYERLITGQETKMVSLRSLAAPDNSDLDTE